MRLYATVSVYRLLAPSTIPNSLSNTAKIKAYDDRELNS